MAEEKKDVFPWVQLIATIGTIVAALIGITPYILKLNSTPTPEPPTIVILTLPPATTVPTPVTTQQTPVQTTETTPVTTVETTTPATTGPPPTGNETPVATTVATTTGATVQTTPPALPISIGVNMSTLTRGDLLFATGLTDPSVQQVSISVNSSTYQSGIVPTNVFQGGEFEFAINTSAFDPGSYTIWAIIPGTSSAASAPFVILPA